jgi:hypothetical protein
MEIGPPGPIPRDSLAITFFNLLSRISLIGHRAEPEFRSEFTESGRFGGPHSVDSGSGLRALCGKNSFQEWVKGSRKSEWYWTR